MSVRGGSVAGYRTPAVPVVYAGPGDIVLGARAWWGLRAYSNATIGINAVRLRRGSDNAEQDFTTVTGGGIDLSGINSFRGAANVFVAKLYDQTGGGLDMVQATAAKQPQFVLNVIGTNPSIQYVAANSQTLAATITSVAQPYSVSAVANRTDSAGSFRSLLSTSGSIEMDFSNTVDVLNLFTTGGPALLTGVAHNAFHGICFIANSPSCFISADGTDGSTLNSGANPTGTTIYIGSFADASQYMEGYIPEVGLWPVAISSSDAHSLSTNQHNYWGF